MSRPADDRFTETQQVRMSVEMMAQIDAYVAERRRAEPLCKMDRTDAIRLLVAEALANHGARKGKRA